MGIPQIILLLLYATSLGISLSKHGETRKYDFWSSLIGCIIEVLLLYWGGFFKGV